MQVSLDGFIEGPDGAMDWIFYNSDETWREFFARLETVDTILVGRKMYPAYERYWGSLFQGSPELPDEKPLNENELRYARWARKTQHIVFSQTLEEVEWRNTRIVTNHIKEEILELKKQPGKDMMLLGGAGLVSTFRELDLIDEYRLVVNPVVLGDGVPLFSEAKERHPLKWTGTRTLPTGAVILSYRSGTVG